MNAFYKVHRYAENVLRQSLSQIARCGARAWQTNKQGEGFLLDSRWLYIALVIWNPRYVERGVEEVARSRSAFRDGIVE